REAAKIIGISPATLMRVEAGRVPDVGTFGKVCAWLKMDPGSFLGFQAGTEPGRSTPLAGALSVSAHLKAEQTPKPETVKALATLILIAASTKAATPCIPTDEVA